MTGKPGMPDFLGSLGPGVTALLVEIQGADGAEVASRVGQRVAAHCPKRRRHVRSNSAPILI